MYNDDIEETLNIEKKVTVLKHRNLLLVSNFVTK